MLISPEYKALNAKLHQSKPAFGSKGGKPWPIIKALCEERGYKTILDYGCGKAGLRTTMPDYEVYEYDPGLDIDQRRPCDLVYSRDVLEHVEPECLPDVLDDLRRLTIKRLWLLIATSKSGDVLSDGRNAHLIVQDIRWWISKIESHGFQLVTTAAASKRAGQIECIPI